MEETVPQVLKTNTSIEDKDKMLYTQCIRRRGRGCANQSFNRRRRHGHASKILIKFVDKSTKLGRTRT